jgi:hypothetical protein
MGALRTKERETATATMARKRSGVGSFIGLLPGEGIGRTVPEEFLRLLFLSAGCFPALDPVVHVKIQRLHL